MSLDKLRVHIENMLKLTELRLKDVYDNHKEKDGCFKESMFNSRLVFPKKRDDKTRVSEQELRFCFIEVFNEYCNLKGLQLYYSIETPTSCRYDFSEEGLKMDEEGKGRSGMFDLVILNKDSERVCLIEFKAHTADKEDYKKDFEKLENPKEGAENVLRYFVNIFDNANDGTKSKLEENEEKAREHTKQKFNGKNISATLCYFSLDGKLSLNDLTPALN